MENDLQGFVLPTYNLAARISVTGPFFASDLGLFNGTKPIHTYHLEVDEWMQNLDLGDDGLADISDAPPCPVLSSPLYFVELTIPSMEPAHYRYIGKASKQNLLARLSKHTKLNPLIYKCLESRGKFRMFGGDIDIYWGGGEWLPYDTFIDGTGESIEETVTSLEKALIFAWQPNVNSKGKRTYTGTIPVWIEIQKCPWDDVPHRFEIIDEQGSKYVLAPPRTKIARDEAEFVKMHPGFFSSFKQQESEEE